MVRVFVVNARPEERAALCLLLADLHMDIVGNASDWKTTLAKAPAARFDLLLVDADLLPADPMLGMTELRRTCSHEFFAVLIGQLDAHQQAAFSAGADEFISKSEVPKRLADRLRVAAKSIAI